MFNPTFCMYVPVQSQEPVIQWFVAVLHICFCVHYFVVRGYNPYFSRLNCFTFVISGHKYRAPPL